MDHRVTPGKMSNEDHPHIKHVRASFVPEEAPQVGDFGNHLLTRFDCQTAPSPTSAYAT
jgi:hypothetical protein